MSEKRKDNKGRVLRTGESQRKDLIYQYRYTDVHGKRNTVYAPDLKELREKEKEIQKHLDEGVDYAAGKINVIQLLERYISIKQGVRYNTKVSYNTILNIMKNEDFGYRKIQDIRISDAQRWLVKLHEDGRGYGTITRIRGVIKSSFQMAYDEDIVRRNPFDFKLTNIIPNDSEKRLALTEGQQTILMDFIREDKTYSKYYDEFLILLWTGMRVSEFCGLTMDDIDFDERRIRVDHQLSKKLNGEYYVGDPKTDCGCRYIPMTDEVCQSLQNIISNRKCVGKERVIDGYSGFILLNRNGNPKTAENIKYEFLQVAKKFKKLHPENQALNISAHVFRHTFCTNMINAGVDIKTIQYIMGHASSGVTLDVYTHTNYERVAEQMKKVFNSKDPGGRNPRENQAGGLLATTPITTPIAGISA